MAESRVLVLDADPNRAQSLRSLLQFIDYAPVLHERCGGLAGSGAKPADWVAVILGTVLDESALGPFVDWLKRDHLHPPLLVLPEHQAHAAARFDLHESTCITLEFPLKYAELNELLKRAGLTRIEREALDTVVSQLERCLRGSVRLAVNLMGQSRAEPVLPPAGVDLKGHIEHIEASLIKQALAQSGGVVAHAAKLLNTRRTTLVEKLRKYGLQREEFEANCASEA